MEPILIGIIVAFVLIAFWFFATYNRLIVMEQEVENAWSNIDVVLQERYDSLGNMARAAEDFAKGGFRVVPPATARRGSFIGKNVVLMPSYVNIGAYVDEGSMVDTWATVGS